MTRAIGWTIAALGIATSPLAAQQHQHAAPAAHDSAATPVVTGGCVHAMMGSSGMQMVQGGMVMPGMSGTMHADSGAMMPGMMMMMQAMRFAPRVVLAARDSLGLTPAQIARVEALAGQWEMPARHMADMRAAEQRLTQAFDRATADTAAIRTAAERLAVVHARGQARHLAAAARVREVLTSAQREQLAQRSAPCSMNGAEASPAAGSVGHEGHHKPASPRR